MEKRKIYGTIIAIITFVLIMVGMSYAYFYWSSGDERTNVNLTITKGLEGVVVYNQGVSVLGTDNYSLQASDDYTGGINATIEFWKKPSYTGNIYGQISLEILQMLSVFGTTDANVGKTDTVKWAITTYTAEDTTEVLVKEGTFNGKSQGDKFALTENFTLNNRQTFYKIYIWLDDTAIDANYSVIGELLSTEISASASDTMSHYGTPPIQVLANLGLEDKVKDTTPDFSVMSPVITSYAENVSTGETVELNSTITGNRTFATSYTFDATTGNYTLSGTTSTYQTYNSNAVEKYTCNSTSTTCSTLYKIKKVSVSDATTNYSETAWQGYYSTLTSSSNKAIGTSYTFDGTNYQLAGTITTGVSYSTEYESNDSVSYYTCNNSTGTNCSALYKIETVTDTSVTASQRKSRTQNYNYATEADVYTNKAATYNEDDIGIFSAEDNFGTSYYFRGNPDYNYVKFGKNADGNDMYWRIIRINGDGTIRMIYMGTDINVTELTPVGTSAFNTKYSDNTYVGYMYGATGQSTYELTHANTTNSTIKTFLEGTEANNYEDGWYYENIVATGYHDYVADAIYCNDRSTTTGGAGTAVTSYSAKARLTGTTVIPTLKCDLEDYTNDSFTVSDELGNGLLEYPVGLITADEVAMAGGKYNTQNVKYYLYTGQDYRTMSPYYFHGSDSSVFFLEGGKLNFSYNSYGKRGVLPVISLRSDAIKYGTGTVIDPFTINE